MHRYSKTTVTLPDFQVIGPSEIWLESDMADSPDFYISEIGVTDLPIFVFTLPDFWEISSKKSADSKKSGSGTTAKHSNGVPSASTKETRDVLHSVKFFLSSSEMRL